MQAGKLDRVATLSRLTSEQDEFGEVRDTWADYATVRAGLTSQTEADFLAEYGATQQQAVAVTIRYLADVSAKDRIAIDGTTYEITAVSEIGRRRGLALRCEAVE